MKRHHGHSKSLKGKHLVGLAYSSEVQAILVGSAQADIAGEGAESSTFESVGSSKSESLNLA